MLRIYTIDFETRHSAMNDKPDNSYLFWFWPAWMILLSIMFFLRMTVLRGTPTNIRFFSMMMYILLVQGSLFVTTLYENTRILAYLQRHHPEAYAKAMQPRWFNPHPDGIRSGAVFLSSHRDDPTMDRLQANFMHLTALFILSFMTLPCMCATFIS